MSRFTLFILYVLTVVSLMSLTSCTRKIDIVEYQPQIISQPVVIRELPPKKPESNEKKLIVIDAGHGGTDFGTEVKKPSFKEKNLNLVTARFLKGYLEQMGYKTLMTRNEDAFVPLEKRAIFANSRNADLFVSVHYNSAPSAKAEGIEIFYYRNDSNKERVLASQMLAETVLKHLIDVTEAKSRGVKHGNLAVLRKTTMPAILAESGFFSNENELQKLRDPAYIKSIAWGIAQGIQAYLNKD